MRFILSLIFLLPSIAFADGVFDCGTGATAIITHPSTNSDRLTVNGVLMVVSTDQNLVFDCYSILTVECSDHNDNRTVIIPKSVSKDTDYLIKVASFLIGSFTGIAFVLASNTLNGTNI